MNELENAIRKHIADNFDVDNHDDCAICIAYFIGVNNSKPF